MDKEKKDLLVFGYGIALIAFIAGMAGILKHGVEPYSLALCVCGMVLLLVTFLDWPSLRLGYKGWMHVARFLASMVTTLLLSLVFLIFFVPIGLFLRITGRDLLDIRINKAARTYWSPRAKEPFQRERYEQQF